MPAFNQHESHDIVRILIVGDSGGGKTGALASLVDAGLNIRVLDFDNGLSVLGGYVKDKEKLGANVHYETLRDELSLTGSRVGIKKAAAFQRAMDLLEKGGDLWGVGSNIPPLTKWTSRDVLVVDSLSVMGKASLQMVMAANAAGWKAPEIQHYGTAMDNIEKFLDIITSKAVGCNVVVNTHAYMPEGSTKMVPEALGSKLGPKVPKMFDNMVSLSLTAGERTFKTKRDGLLACKTSKPILDTYPIATGLADIFKALTGRKNLGE